MYITSIIIISTTAIVTFIIKRQFDKRYSKANVGNVKRVLRKILIIENKLPKFSEGTVENYIAKRLSKRFRQVVTQKSIGGRKYAREKIDIDIKDGKVGIELKLAKSLFGSNERNRLLGQLDLYLQRRYDKKRLLVAVVGRLEEENHIALEELREIIQKKKINYVFVKVV